MAALLSIVILLLTTAISQTVSQSLSGRAGWTWYTSYAECCPDNPNYNPNAPTTECTDYSACDYSGAFAAFKDKKSLSYVQSHSLVAFFDSSNPSLQYFESNYAGKTIVLTHGNENITAIIADTCADSDCSDCCTQNAHSSGYLVDMEYWTVINNFGSTNAVNGQINFVIMDSNNDSQINTLNPTHTPTLSPIDPSKNPTQFPTIINCLSVSCDLTSHPTTLPTALPNMSPTASTSTPTVTPTLNPTQTQTILNPTLIPTVKPTFITTFEPTQIQTTLTPTMFIPTLIPTTALTNVSISKDRPYLFTVAAAIKGQQVTVDWVSERKHYFENAFLKSVGLETSENVRVQMTNIDEQRRRMQYSDGNIEGGVMIGFWVIINDRMDYDTFNSAINDMDRVRQSFAEAIAEDISGITVESMQVTNRGNYNINYTQSVKNDMFIQYAVIIAVSVMIILSFIGVAIRMKCVCCNCNICPQTHEYETTDFSDTESESNDGLIFKKFEYML